MRLWHVELLPYLPKGQLVAQWRELNSIFVKEDKHILINYIYNYPKDDLYTYTKRVINEMFKRGYTIRSYEKMEHYFKDLELSIVPHPYIYHHDDEYLEICFFNLKEKFMRGQKDYDKQQYDDLFQYVKNKLNSSS